MMDKHMMTEEEMSVHMKKKRMKAKKPSEMEKAQMAMKDMKNKGI